MQDSTYFFWFLFRDFTISHIFYKIQNINKFQLVSIITQWTYTCQNPWALVPKLRNSNFEKYLKKKTVALTKHINLNASSKLQNVTKLTNSSVTKLKTRQNL